ncbi:MAG: radical SAM family heme chaperone HemW [Chitinophagales bacterium]|nr:radical SAM family heme chaperone HemW [Chitinophagales bacterium]
MAGIYIHIPFCKQACNYCNFYFSTSLQNKVQFIEALLAEIELTKSYLEAEPVETIYFGGGTPTLLTIEDWRLIIDALGSVYALHHLLEFTIEANPDDLKDRKYLSGLADLGVNRFSIGIQSFFEDDLRYMNRAHTATEATEAVKRVQDAGFSNITIDLIYGTPTMNNEQWLQNLGTAFQLNVPHISAYALTVEPKTVLENKIRKKQLAPVDDVQSAKHFEILLSEMKKHGFEQYEISNFAKPDAYAIHNSNYWLGKKYLGLGPSAHSYNGTIRSWNVSNNLTYINSLRKGQRAFEQETLTPAQAVNEKIMTGLRTKWGVNISDFGFQISNLMRRNLKTVDEHCYTLENDLLRLTDAGKLYADGIAAQLFIDDEHISLQ